MPVAPLTITRLTTGPDLIARATAAGTGIIEIAADDAGTMQKELDQIIAAIAALIAAGITAPIAVATKSPLVADQAIEAGATVIRDRDNLQGAPEMAEIIALHRAKVVIGSENGERSIAIAIATAAGIAPADIIQNSER